MKSDSFWAVASSTDSPRLAREMVAQDSAVSRMQRVPVPRGWPRNQFMKVMTNLIYQTTHAGNNVLLAHTVRPMSEPCVAMTERRDLDPRSMDETSVRAGARLVEELTRRTLQKSELARLLDSDFQRINCWCKGQGFNAKNRRRVAKALELDEDFFTRDPAKADEQRREETRLRVFAEFLKTDVGRSGSKEHLDALRDAPVPKGKRPTVAWYQGNLLNMQGLLADDQMDETIAENEQLSESVEKKKTRPRR